MAFDPPYSTGIFETIINVHFGNIYLYVSVFADINSLSVGPATAPTILLPTASSAKLKDSVKLIDTFTDPAGVVNTGPTTTAYFQWISPQIAVVGFNPDGSPIFGPVGHTFDDAYANFHATHRPPAIYFGSSQGAPSPSFPTNPPVIVIATGGDGTLYYANLSSQSVRSVADRAVKHDYLYGIPAGVDLVEVIVKGLVISSTNTPPYSTVINSSSSIDLRVYSRVHGSVTKLKQLIRYAPDTKPKPDPDDKYVAAPTPTTQGVFKVSVHLDKKHTQIDDYGKEYHPYKVTLNPDIGHDVPPDQPPPSLGLLPK